MVGAKGCALVATWFIVLDCAGAARLVCSLRNVGTKVFVRLREQTRPEGAIPGVVGSTSGWKRPLRNRQDQMEQFHGVVGSTSGWKRPR